MGCEARSYDEHMSPRSERASAPRRSRSALVSTALLFCLTRPALPQAPSCAWGDGVTLPVPATIGGHLLLIASDGGAGVLAFTARETAWLAPNHGVLTMFHVLEQGRLDPSLPAAGVPVLSGADIPNHETLEPWRAIPDGTGGVYLLTQACDPESSRTWKLRCWEVSQVRLQHVTAQGAPAPGWPALGHVFDSFDFAREIVDIVPDGAGGVIAVWLDGTVATAPIRAQRFAPDGTTRWPGGMAGLTALTSTYGHGSLRIAGDGAGGVVAVANRRVSSVDYRMELIACKVDASGNLAWGTTGKPVMQQPTYSASPSGVTVDVEGRSFVTAVLSPVSGGTAQFYTQFLTALGARAWGTFGVPIGPCGSSAPAAQLVLPSGYASLHPDFSNSHHLQIQDATGLPQVGDTEGLPLVSTPIPPQPLTTEDGHVILVWATNYAGPDPPDVRAVEFDEWVNLAPGWPDTGMPVCGAIAGLGLGDAFVAAGHLFVGLASSGWYSALPRVQRLSREVLAVDDMLPARALELAPPRPNPARGAWSIEVAVREASPVTLDAFDVAGRRVLAEDFGTLEPGRHPLTASAGAALAAGVYRVRVRAGANVAERMLVKVR